ncbi:MAG: hypothetical protein L6R39_004981, partial [Caloplaca ligustica]
MPPVRLVRSVESLRAVSYDDTTAAQPPIPVTAATPPSLSPLHSKLSPDQQWLPRKVRSNLRDDSRRDSGLAPSSSTARDSRTTISTDIDSSRSIRNSPSLPQLSTPGDSVLSIPTTPKRCRTPPLHDSDIPPVPQMPFVGLVTEIPTGSLDDLTSPDHIEFSKRGSMLIGGRKARRDTNASFHPRPVRSRKPSVHLSSPTSTVPKRILSADEEMLSSKVRAMYEGATDDDSETASVRQLDNGDSSRIPSQQHSSSDEKHNDHVPPSLDAKRESNSPSHTSKNILSILPEEKELAGGIEDWNNVDNGDVDRYGFILPSEPSRHSSFASLSSRPREPPRIQRVSTVLQIASEAPRRRRSKLGRTPSSAKSPSRSINRPESRNNRPASSHSSYRDTLNNTQSKLRTAANILPLHRDRRCLDEAGDMLTLPPGLANITDDGEDSKHLEAARLRERRREEKWQKMARVTNPNDHKSMVGGGMTFHFDTKSPKVIERTWKGIPDRWRATAWHAFLTASAKRRKEPLPSDEDLKSAFHTLLKQSSPDDVQIDIDVPRTINSHIMFRRRYRGGQRLLFRVLHALSIYFPDTGYVQGMAALAATLLCYYAEDMAFVMLVRLWQLRGLERLYQSGFDGLMQALDEFEQGWLANGEVSAKLNELGIAPTAYGTR